MGQLRKARSGPDSVTVDIPSGLDWFVWRVLTHERNRATLAEVESAWSIDDLLTAHLAFDVHDELQFQINKKLREQQ